MCERRKHNVAMLRKHLIIFHEKLGEDFFAMGDHLCTEIVGLMSTYCLILTY